MDVLELKFLLKLLGFPDYRAPIGEIKPNPKTTTAERDAICRALSRRSLVDYSLEVVAIAITPAGKSLLSLDTSKTSKLPITITEPELKIMRSCADTAIAPTSIDIPPASREHSIQSLISRGLIKAEKTQIQEVWLTQRAEEYLREEYNPSGANPILSLDLLGNYLRLVRKFLRDRAVREDEALPMQPYLEKELPSHLGDEEILQVIGDLDKELGTENYLPIFYLRQRVQPPLSRDELDRTLYRLQRHNRIELSSLQEAIAYSPEQIEAGLHQDIGGPLFFIIVN